MAENQSTVLGGASRNTHECNNTSFLMYSDVSMTALPAGGSAPQSAEQSLRKLLTTNKYGK